MSVIDGMACATPGCDNRGKPGFNIVSHGSFATKSGRRQRYRCTVCRGTVSTNTGTAYRGRRCTRREFEQVASLRVEGVSISATARVTGHSRNTIARWLERASTAAERFNDRMLRDFDLMELQADELCTFVGNKNTTVWLFATIEVSSRLWAGSVLGRRSDHNARAVINDVVRRGRMVGCPLIATDGFEYYLGAVGDLTGSACVYGQVLKTRRNNRVVRVERRVKLGTADRLQAALWKSEDSETLNTSFVERLNLTIRQASAYLRRRSPCHARGADQLRSHVELVGCHYNFVRPHSALRFGRETRTPAMQAGLVSTRLALSDIFTTGRVTLRMFVAVALDGCQAALYLVHGIGEGADYHRQEVKAAESFCQAAATAGVARIVYLGGVAPTGTGSEHLRSRLDVGETLRSGPVPTIELRASMIVGYGSLSWLIVRDLAARLPVMVLPRWLKSRTQPVAIDDVVIALVRAVDLPLEASAWWDIPGPDVLSGQEILEETSRVMELAHPHMVAVPFLSPRLSSLWVRFVTRAQWSVAREVVIGLTEDLLARDDRFWQLVDRPHRLTFAEAARRAIDAERADGPVPGLWGTVERARGRVGR